MPPRPVDSGRSRWDDARQGGSPMDRLRHCVSRRHLVQRMSALALGAFTLAGCSPRSAQPPAAAQPRVPRIGWLSTGPPPPPGSAPNTDAFRLGMADLGYIEGQSYVVEPRWLQPADEDYTLPAQALVASGVDVIVTVA